MNELLGKYLNGYKIVSIEKDPFIKGQVNLWTDVYEHNHFGDRNIIKFFVRDENNSNKIYRELIDKEVYNLRKRIDNAIKYIENWEGIWYSNTHQEDKENLIELIKILKGSDIDE